MCRKLIQNQTFNSWQKILFFFSFLLTVICFLQNIFLMYSDGSFLLNSDASAELLLSAHLNEEHSLISKNWYYSTELKVLSTQLIFKPALFLFQNNWSAARLFGIICFMISLIFAACYLAWAIGCSELAFLFSFILICPIGKEYGWNVIICSYYAPYIFISITSIALVFHIATRASGKKRIILCVCLSVYALLAGLGGFRQLITCFIPFFLACLLCFIISTDKDVPLKTLLSSLLLLIPSLIGSYVNTTVLSAVFSFSSYNSVVWNKFSLEQAISVIGDLLQMYGWQSDSNLLGFAGIVNCISIMLPFLVIAISIFLISKFATLSYPLKVSLCFTLFSFCIQLLVMSQSSLSYNSTYWIPWVPFSLILLLQGSNEIQCKAFRIFLIAMVSVCIFLCGISTRNNPYMDWVPNSKNIIKPVEYLVSENYKNGFASFWESNIVTELSDGQIEMWTITHPLDYSINPWLQKKEHSDTMPEGKIFLLVPSNYKSNPIYDTKFYQEHIAYEDEAYIIYSFSSVFEWLAPQ